MKCPNCGSNKNLLTNKHEWVELQCEDCGTEWTKYYGGSKTIRIPIPKPKQKGWQLITVEKERLVYIRRRWKK